MAAGLNGCVSTQEYIARMDDMAKWVGVDRLGYLLSVPITFCELWVATPWVRLSLLWTVDTATAVLFARQMLKYGACCALARREGHDAQLGWKPGCSQHPGRAVGIQLQYSASPLVFAVLNDGIRRRREQAQRWERRGARLHWVVSYVHGSQFAS